MLESLDSVFLDCFNYAYGLLRTHLASYILFLCILIYSTKQLWNYKRKLTKPRTMVDFLSLIIVYGSIFFLIAFNGWFVFIHFHTFRMLN